MRCPIANGLMGVGGGGCREFHSEASQETSQRWLLPLPQSANPAKMAAFKPLSRPSIHVPSGRVTVQPFSREDCTVDELRV